MIRIIDERIRRHLNGLRFAFRGIVTLVKAAGAVQLVQGEGLKGEQVQGAEMFQHFGFTSNVPADSMFILLPLGGKTGHGIIIATENGTYRLKNLESGETAIYNQWGDHVKLGKDRHMKLVSNVAVDIQSPKTTMSGDLDVQGNIVAQGDISDHGNKSMAGMRQVFNDHQQAVSGSVAAAPAGKM